MKIKVAQFRVVGVLMITAALFLFLQAITGGANIYLGFTSGVDFEPRDLAAFLIFMALLLLPFAVATLFVGKWRMLSFPIASVLSFGIFLEFPLKFTAELQSDAYYRDGRSMGIRGSDVWFGHIPYWKSHFTEANHPRGDTGERWAYAGNGYWGKHFRYNLVWPENDPWTGEHNKVYECITWETTHFLGYFARDMRGDSLLYRSGSQLPKDKCTLVKELVAESSEAEAN